MSSHHETGGYQRALTASGHLVLWAFAWALTLALAKFGPPLLWGSQNPVVSWAAIALNIAVGIGWIITFTRFLREIDELQRKILMDALAVTLGAGWIGGLAYIVAEGSGLLSVKIDIGILLALLGVVYMLAFIVGKVRYR